MPGAAWRDPGAQWDWQCLQLQQIWGGTLNQDQPLQGAWRGSSRFQQPRVLQGSRHKGHGAGLHITLLLLGTDGAAAQTDADGKRMGSVWPASLPAPAPVLRCQAGDALARDALARDATGSNKHRARGNRGIGSTWGHSCTEQSALCPALS